MIVTLTGYGSSCFPGLSLDKVYVQTFKGLSSPQCVHSVLTSNDGCSGPALTAEIGFLVIFKCQS